MTRHAPRLTPWLRATLLLSLVAGLSGCGVWSWAFGPDRPSPKAIPPLVKGEHQIEIGQDWQARLYGRWRLSTYNAARIQVAAQQIVVADDSGHLLGLSRDGKQEWLRRLDGKSASGPTLARGVIYIGTDAGKLYAFSAHDGKRLWEVSLGAQVLSPVVVAGSQILVQLANGHLLAVNAHDGKTIWTFSMTQPSLMLRTVSAPVVDGDTVYAGFSDGNVVALNLQSGAELWRAAVAIPHGSNELARMVDVSASPVVDGDQVIAAAYQGNIAAFDRQSGEESWSVPMSVVLTPVLHDDRLYVAQADGRVAAIDPHSGAVYWRNDVLQGHNLSGMTFCGGHLVLSGDDGFLFVMDPRTGHRVGQSKISGSGIESQPTCVGKDHVLVMSGVGTLYQLRLRPR